MTRTNRISPRCAIVAHLLLLALTAISYSRPACAVQVAETNEQSERAGAPADDAALLTHLRATVVDVSWEGIDFEDVIDDVRERYKLNIMVMWQLVEQAGVRKDDRVELRLNEVPLYTVLQMALRQVSTGGDELSISVENGIILIRPRGWGRVPTVLRAYDIADLIESGYSVRRFASTPVLSLEVTGREFIGGEQRREPESGGGGGMGGGAGGGGSGSGGSIFTGGDIDIHSHDTMELIDRYIGLIQEYVDPEGWRNLGGDVGTVHSVNTVLLINQTIENHEDIRMLLDLLRTTRPRVLDGDAWIIRLRADKAEQWRTQFDGSFPRLGSGQIDELLEDPDQYELLFRGTTSGFNGQRMWFSALTQRDVLTTFAGATGDAANAFTPHSSVVTEGLELIALPLLAPGAGHVELDVQLAWKPEVSVSQHPVVLVSGAEQGSIDQVRHSMRSVSTTLEMQLGNAVVLTVPGEVSAEDAAYEDWLIVRVDEMD